MPLLDLSPLERTVTSKVRKRGRQLAASGSVTLEERTSPDEPVEASVDDSDVDVYYVTLRYDDGALWAHCSCPRFGDVFELCGDIWATLAECVSKKVEFPGPVEELFADEWNEDLGWDADQPFGGTEELEKLGHELSLLNTSLKSAAPVQPARPERVAPSRWRWQLNQIAYGGGGVDAVPPPPEIIWVLDPAQSGTAVSLQITFRSRKANGELGKPQPFRVDSSAIPRIASPVDREILAILSSSHYFHGPLDAQWSIGWPLAEFVLPKLVTTERLWIRTGKGEYGRIAFFDNGEPWRLAIRAEEREGREREGKYVLNATLQRGEEKLPIAEPLAITRGGLVVFRDSIARFADEGTQAWATLLLREQVEIPAAELDDFVKSISSLRVPVSIELPVEATWQERRVAPRGSIELVDRGYGFIQGRPMFEYEGHGTPALVPSRAVYDDATRTMFVRDVAEELRLLNALWAQHAQRHGDSISFYQASLPAAIPKLIDAGWEVRGADGLYAGSGALELEVSSGIDWFDVEGTIHFGSEQVRLPELLAALRKGESVVRLTDGRLGLVDPDWRQQLEPFIASAADEHSGTLRFRGNQVLLLDALLATRKNVSFDEVFEQARRRILDVKIEPEQPPDTFRGTLRPYQTEGLGWFSFLRGLGFGGCLADDMGLGKTVQVLALLDQRRRAAGEDRRPSLVVAPRSVVFNWKNEAARFTPELRLLDHSTPDRIRAADHFSQYDVVLTTYALLRKEAALFADFEFDYVILDEAQAIKNAQSLAAKAATLLRARYRLALSGTPVENHLGELASLFDFLNPGMLRAKSTKVMAMLRNAGSKTPEAASARTMLARAVRPFILRRTKAQVAPELPDRVEQTIWCELEPKQRQLYDELRDYYRASILGRVASSGINRSKIHILEALLRMRQAACHPGLVDKNRTGETSAKLDALFEELPILIDGGHKVLVFSQFTSLLSIVRKEMFERKLAHAYIDGSSQDREAQVKRFQEDPRVSLFLISLKAGGLGLNLTAAEYVFLLDPWWNPAVEAQAIDRAHRIGQSRNVFAYRLVARDTIEEKIL
ncbi:MAG TPA: DEAD/DEAH box helicase, partial [Thermoanaerobaculia bacterium]|nr:DEAD/DEAH box helicase [Thermoanaerobaculia bacterium]